MPIKFNSPNKSFQEDLRILYANFFERKKIRPTGNRELYKKAIIFGISWIVIYTALVLIPTNNSPTIFLSILLSVLLGCTNAGIGFNIMHDGNHRSFSSQKWVNNLMGFTLNFLGGNAALWNIKHNVVHHTATNVAGHDDDIAAGPIARFHPDQKWRPHHRFQFLYVPLIVYPIQYLLWIYFLDFGKYFKGEICGVKINFHKRERLVFWLSKIMHIVVFICVPLLNHSLYTVLIGYAIVLGTTGLLISTIFQLAHVVTQTAMVSAVRDVHGNDIVGENNKIHQVRTTANFATHSQFWTWFSGGLNFQVEHHLFPGVSHVHYPKLQPFIVDLCRKHNLPYNENPTFLSAVWSHIVTLWYFGKKRYSIIH